MNTSSNPTSPGNTVGEDSVVTFDSVPGGVLVERRGDHGILWYTVLSVAPDSSLSLSGFCKPALPPAQPGPIDSVGRSKRS